MIVEVHSGTWLHLKSEAEGRKQLQGASYQIFQWSGEGWYHIQNYQQWWSRGHCFDNVIRIICAKDRLEEVREGMRDLANELREARVRQ